MSPILSKTPREFDTSACGLRAASGDISEVLSLLSGGVRPEPATVVRLCQSLRLLKGWLIQTAAFAEAAGAVHSADGQEVPHEPH